MRRSIFGLLFAFAVVVAGPGLNAQQKAQFLVPMTAADGAPVESVAPDDLVIFENGKEVRVLSVEPRDRPLNVTLAVDNGRMLADTLVHIRNHAKLFFEALPEGTEASLVTTAPQPRYVVRNSTDRGVLLKAVDRIAPDSGPGRFIEMLQDVAATWAKGPSEVNYVLVGFGSTFSAEYIHKRNLEEAFQRMAKVRGTVHVVMFRPAGATEGDAQHGIGQGVAQDTRGRYQEIGSHLQLDALSGMGAEIARTAGSGRQFLVTIERPEGATGPLGPLSMSPKSGLKPGRITRLP